MNDVFIRIVPLPEHINAATIPDENGDYNVYLSSRISEGRRRRALLHELGHISRGHFYGDASVAEKENELK